MEKICMIVPARGQSRAVPRKALQDVCGVTLLGRVLSYLVDCDLDLMERGELRLDIVVVTDDKEIGQVAENQGCRYVLEPPVAPDGENQLRAIQFAVDACGPENYDFVGVLNGTSPIHPVGIIPRAVKKLKESKYEVDGITILSEAAENPWRMINLAKIGGPVRYEGTFTERQKQPKFGSHAGFHIWWMQKFLQLPKTSIKDFWENAKYLAIVREGMCFDVDTPQDLALLRAVYCYGTRHFLQ